MVKLSVIMTVYNMERYVRDSIEGVLNQSFQDFELIIVIDGGSDRSWEICKVYSEQDERIHLKLTENQGTAAARNTGIAMAKGAYIGFVDGDDWIEPSFYEVLIRALEGTESDIATCGFIKIENRLALKYLSDDKLSKLYVYSPEEAIAMTFERDKMRYSPCNKVYRRELFENILYPAGVLYEDKATTYRLFHRAKQVVYLDVALYHYYIRPDSVMRQPITSANFTLFKVNEDLITFLKAHYPKLVATAEKSYLEECQALVERLSDQRAYEAEQTYCREIIERLKGE